MNFEEVEENKIYYKGSQSVCVLTDYSCGQLGVPRKSMFSMLDFYKWVYSPSKQGGYDNTGKRVNAYILVQKGQ